MGRKSGDVAALPTTRSGDFVGIVKASTPFSVYNMQTAHCKTKIEARSDLMMSRSSAVQMVKVVGDGSRRRDRILKSSKIASTPRA